MLSFELNWGPHILHNKETKHIVLNCVKTAWIDFSSVTSLPLDGAISRVHAFIYCIEIAIGEFWITLYKNFAERINTPSSRLDSYGYEALTRVKMYRFSPKSDTINAKNELQKRAKGQGEREKKWGERLRTWRRGELPRVWTDMLLIRHTFGLLLY